MLDYGILQWGESARDLAPLRPGERLRGSCPPRNAAPRQVIWGTGIYTDDSALCWVGVHYGLITEADGGVVVIEQRPGLPAYVGSRRNNVDSYDYGAWPWSIVLVH